MTCEELLESRGFKVINNTGVSFDIFTNDNDGAMSLLRELGFRHRILDNGLLSAVGHVRCDVGATSPLPADWISGVSPISPCE